MKLEVANTTSTLIVRLPLLVQVHVLRAGLSHGFGDRSVARVLLTTRTPFHGLLTIVQSACAIVLVLHDPPPDPQVAVKDRHWNVDDIGKTSTIVGSHWPSLSLSIVGLG